MQINPLKLEGVFEITLECFKDNRGYFMETFSRKKFAEYGLDKYDWVQENQSLSAKKDTVRGLHFQTPPFAQAKLVRVIQGEILDVFVDLRSNSETFGEWDSIVLSAENLKSVLIPRGFAHGFRTLTENVIVQYKVDNDYSRKSEQSIRWNDPDLKIDWGVSEGILSDKDLQAEFFKDFVSPF